MTSFIEAGFSKTGERVNVDVAGIEALCELILRFAKEINKTLANRKSAN
jgi:hypothetical protein